MSKELQVENLRLKYGSKWVVFTLRYGEEGLLDMEVNCPSSGLEKESFVRIAKEISSLAYSGTRSRKYIRGTLNRMSRVDSQVLKFMLVLVNDKLHLED